MKTTEKALRVAYVVLVAVWLSVVAGCGNDEWPGQQVDIPADGDGTSTNPPPGDGTATNPPPGGGTATNAVGPVIVAVGDSITEGSQIDGDPYPEILSRRLGVEVYNEGVGGSSSVRGVALMDDMLRYYHPDYVLIMYGVNDVRRTSMADDSTAMARMDEVIRNLDTMVGMVEASGARPLVATIVPRFDPDPYLNASHVVLNEEIRRFAIDEHVYLVDIEEEFANRRSLMLPDGVHPNNDGTALIADCFYEALRDLRVGN